VLDEGVLADEICNHNICFQFKLNPVQRQKISELAQLTY
jgi:hypothetical protein